MVAVLILCILVFGMNDVWSFHSTSSSENRTDIGDVQVTDNAKLLSNFPSHDRKDNIISELRNEPQKTLSSITKIIFENPSVIPGGAIDMDAKKVSNIIKPKLKIPNQNKPDVHKGYVINSPSESRKFKSKVPKSIETKHMINNVANGEHDKKSTIIQINENTTNVPDEVFAKNSTNLRNVDILVDRRGISSIEQNLLLAKADRLSDSKHLDYGKHEIKKATERLEKLKVSTKTYGHATTPNKNIISDSHQSNKTISEIQKESIFMRTQIEASDLSVYEKLSSISPKEFMTKKPTRQAINNFKKESSPSRTSKTHKKKYSKGDYDSQTKTSSYNHQRSHIEKGKIKTEVKTNKSMKNGNQTHTDQAKSARDIKKIIVQRTTFVNKGNENKVQMGKPSGTIIKTGLGTDNVLNNRNITFQKETILRNSDKSKLKKERLLRNGDNNRVQNVPFLRKVDKSVKEEEHFLIGNDKGIVQKETFSRNDDKTRVKKENVLRKGNKNTLQKGNYLRNGGKAEKQKSKTLRKSKKTKGQKTKLFGNAKSSEIVKAAASHNHIETEDQITDYLPSNKTTKRNYSGTFRTLRNKNASKSNSSHNNSNFASSNVLNNRTESRKNLQRKQFEEAVLNTFNSKESINSKQSKVSGLDRLNRIILPGIKQTKRNENERRKRNKADTVTHTTRRKSKRRKMHEKWKRRNKSNVLKSKHKKKDFSDNFVLRIKKKQFNNITNDGSNSIKNETIIDHTNKAKILDQTPSEKTLLLTTDLNKFNRHTRNNQNTNKAENRLTTSKVILKNYKDMGSVLNNHTTRKPVYLTHMKAEKNLLDFITTSKTQILPEDRTGASSNVIPSDVPGDTEPVPTIHRSTFDVGYKQATTKDPLIADTNNIISLRSPFGTETLHGHGTQNKKGINLLSTLNQRQHKEIENELIVLETGFAIPSSKPSTSTSETSSALPFTTTSTVYFPTTTTLYGVYPDKAVEEPLSSDDPLNNQITQQPLLETTANPVHEYESTIERTDSAGSIYIAPNSTNITNHLGIHIIKHGMHKYQHGIHTNKHGIHTNQRGIQGEYEMKASTYEYDNLWEKLLGSLNGTSTNSSQLRSHNYNTNRSLNNREHTKEHGNQMKVSPYISDEGVLNNENLQTENVHVEPTDLSPLYKSTKKYVTTKQNKNNDSISPHTTNQLFSDLNIESVGINQTYNNINMPLMAATQRFNTEDWNDKLHYSNDNKEKVWKKNYVNFDTHPSNIKQNEINMNPDSTYVKQNNNKSSIDGLITSAMENSIDYYSPVDKSEVVNHNAAKNLSRITVPTTQSSAELIEKWNALIKQFRKKKIKNNSDLLNFLRKTSQKEQKDNSEFPKVFNNKHTERVLTPSVEWLGINNDNFQKDGHFLQDAPPNQQVTPKKAVRHINDRSHHIHSHHIKSSHSGDTSVKECRDDKNYKLALDVLQTILKNMDKMKTPVRRKTPRRRYLLIPLGPEVNADAGHAWSENPHTEHTSNFRQRKPSHNFDRPIPYRVYPQHH